MFFLAYYDCQHSLFDHAAVWYTCIYTKCMCITLILYYHYCIFGECACAHIQAYLYDFIAGSMMPATTKFLPNAIQPVGKKVSFFLFLCIVTSFTFTSRYNDLTNVFFVVIRCVLSYKYVKPNEKKTENHCLLSSNMHVCMWLQACVGTFFHSLQSFIAYLLNIYRICILIGKLKITKKVTRK